MKAVCLMFLLVTALVNAASMDIHLSTSRLPSGLVSGIRGFLAKTSGVFSAKGEGAGGDHRQISNPRLRGEVGNNRGAFAAKSCVSEDHCKKKKAACSKKCGKPRGGISKKHVDKCVVKCKKCSPTC